MRLIACADVTKPSLRATLSRAVALAIVFIATLQTWPAKAESATTRSSAQLEQLVAPIALYPDPLLSQVLMASTYPLEVVQAARWSRDNPGVSGQALEDAMQKQSWDPSVKALTAVPQTLQMMNDKLDWTQQLGDAFLAQQSDILDAVQRLRARADSNGYLKSTPEQTVTTTRRQEAQQSTSASGPPANVYAIEPTNPDQYYVPVYDPSVVYGAWPYPDYEPFYWYPPGYALGPAYGFGAALLAGAAIWGTVNWLQNRVQINPLRYNSFNRANISNTNWAHNPAHRGAVPYRDRAVAQQFGSQRASAAREAFRGKADAGRQQLSKGKDGAAARSNLKNAANTKAGSKQAGAKQASKQTRSNQAARSKQAGSKQGARPKQTAGNRQRAASRQAARPASRAQRPYAGGRGQRSFASARGGFSRGGGARGGGGRGGGRRSDIELKHDIVLLGHLANGLGFYRFAYNGSNTAYVGVMAQEVQTVTPAAVTRGRDGYLRVFYEQLGLTLQTYQEWLAAGARMPRVIQK
jgi:uncharacterized membrane protein YgcG